MLSYIVMPLLKKEEKKVSTTKLVMKILMVVLGVIEIWMNCDN